MDVLVVIQEGELGSREQKIQIHVNEKLTTEHNALGGKRLRVQLTDPHDPFFYYNLTLAEEDFQGLKHAQELLVDFSGFGSMILQLLEKSVAESRLESPKFSVLFHLEPDSRTAWLKFQEISRYRALSHLTLKFHKGSDAQIKEYLADCIRQLQTESRSSSQSLSSRVDSLESQLGSAQKALQEKNEAMEKVKQELYEKTANFQSQLSGEVASEKERSARAMGDIQNRYETERRKLNEDHAKNTRHMENRIAALEYENKDLTEKRHKHEATIQRLSEQVRGHQEDHQQLRRELETKKFEHNKLDSGFHDRERLLHQLQTKVSMLEQDRSRIQVEHSRQADQLSRVSEQKTRLEQEMSEKSALVTKRETAVKTVSKELVKANEIIRKFQNHVQVEHQKVKLSAQILKEQEKVMGEKEAEIATLREDLRALKADVNSQRLGLAENELEKKKLNDQVDDLEKKLRTNETLIHWLNKQLTTAQARDPGLRLTAPPRETKVSMLEQDRSRIQVEHSRQADQLSRVSEQKTRLEQEMSEKSALVTKRETAVKTVSKELVKANEIIRKFQNHVQVEHQKVKLSAQILKEQEKVMGEKEAEIATLREDLRALKADVNSQRLGLAENELEKKKLNDQVDDLEKKLRTNETLIHWLNKQLTTAQARDPGLRLTAPPREVGSLVGFTPSGMGASSTPRFNGNQKENVQTGIDEKYLQSTLQVGEPSKGLLRQQNGPTSNLPSNVRQNRTTALRNAGILKKSGPSTEPQIASKSSQPLGGANRGSPEDIVYLP
eukprot:maker-scaffold784_size97500-snap-gene-0.28 protein:Tk03000 transcript:maker-scaffold784_size97500-snap-gene-0.28-mRNA-1 annotation:"spindle assembly abnormal protein 6-like protein"